MELQIAAQNFEITDALKAHVATKVGPLQERFHRITQIRVSLHIDNVDQVAEGNIHIDGAEIHATASSNDMYHSVDLMLEKLNSQMSKHKDKLIDQHHQK